MGLGTATAVSWITGKYRQTQCENRQKTENIGLKILFNTHIIFGKLLHMNINCQQK
jgi:hypothetical protein